MSTVKFNAATPILTLNECVDLIGAVGSDVTVLVQGDMGSGKTSLLKMLSARFPTHFPAYFDCTTKDLGDVQIPHIRDAEENSYVRFSPNEEFGVHHNKPVILMLDELGKNRSIINAMLRVMQERSIGSTQLPAGSIVFATTNLGQENVGDMLPPHARNRIMVVRMKKPDAEQWMAWGMENGIEPALMAAVHEFPQMLESFTDVEDPKNNPYIYDPRDTGRTAFVTPRSLEKLSHVLKKRAVLGDHVVLQGAMGLVGAKAANDIMTMVTLGDTLPKYDAIVADPTKVKLPDGVAARIMSCLTCLQRVERGDFNTVFKYIERMPMEIQGMFCTMLMKSGKGVWASQQSGLTAFIHKNFALFKA